MSMLAERRTKKKWCLNPNGKDWSNDDNKFGQRMLEKMGWKKGCGLGANLQGMKEHVRVLAKNDTKGLGCKNNNDIEWIHHQQNFENLLSELACTPCEEIRPPPVSESKPISLEEKSKKSRVRVHYQKFTRGKDVSRYSANDLACIFGKKCSSLDSKSFEMQYSYHINTRNNSEDDSADGMVFDEHTVGQSSNFCGKKTIDDSLPSLLPKHRENDPPVYYSPEDIGVQEKQSDILKEISNVKEKSVAGNNEVQECKHEIEDNSGSHSLPESIENIRSKRKRKRGKDSGNSHEVFTGTMISSSQEEVKECDDVAHEVEEIDIVEECAKRKNKKKKKDKKNRAKLEDKNGEEEMLIAEHAEDTSDIKETGNKNLKKTNVIGEDDTRSSNINMKKISKLYKTHISEEHKEPPVIKKRKKKKMDIQCNGGPDVAGNITSEIVSPLPVDKNTGVNNSQKLISLTNEEEPHQYDSAVKQRIVIKKLKRKSMELGFRGSNLDSVSGYGSL